MLITESKLRNIIAEEYKKLVSEAEPIMWRGRDLRKGKEFDQPGEPHTQRTTPPEILAADKNLANMVDSIAKGDVVRKDDLSRQLKILFKGNEPSTNTAFNTINNIAMRTYSGETYEKIVGIIKNILNSP